jgi:cytochrome c oxidase subunit IV
LSSVGWSNKVSVAGSSFAKLFRVIYAEQFVFKALSNIVCLFIIQIYNTENCRHYSLLGYVKAILLVSIVIHLLPNCSATNAVVPLPQVGSNTKSPGSVVINKQRCITLFDV